MTKPIYLLFEDTENTRGDLFLSSCKIIGLCARDHGYGKQIQTSMYQCLNYFEHLAEPMAQLINVLANEYDQSPLVEEFLGSLPSLEIDFCEGHLGKTFSLFLSTASQFVPKEFVAQMMSIVVFLDRDPYNLRSAVIEAVKNIILYFLANDRSENAQNQIKSLYRLIEERFRDTNSFVRSKVLQVCTELLSKGAVPLDRRHPILLLASDRVSDKSSNVRKRAIQLLSQFVQSHLFCIDGGILTLSVFESKLEHVEKEIEEFVPNENDSEGEDSTLNKLVVLKRYYTEARQFSSQLVTVLQTCFQLLLSTVKTEVIETMDFIVMLHLYKVEEAMDGIHDMLHLVWCKDTSGDEDSKRTIRENLLVLFNKVLFQVEGNAQEQTNNGVKFLIE